MDKILKFIEEKKWLSLGIILILTTLAYANILNNQFVWDDPDFYQNWPALYRVNNLGQLLQGEVPVQHEGNFRPLRSVIQLILFQLFGPKNFFAYHLISLLIHLFSVIAVYLIVERWLKNRFLAWLNALLFGLHPIHTEAISYLTTSIDVVGVTLLLWSIYFYLKNQELPKPKSSFLISSWLLALMAFFTYEMTLVLPLLLLLIEWFKLNFSFDQIFKKVKLLWPYWLAIALWLLARLSANVGMRSLTPDPSQSSLSIRILTMGKAIVKYIYLLIWPMPLNVFHKINFSYSLAEPKVFLSWLVVIGLFIVAIIWRKKIPLLSFSIFWFYLALLPVSNIFPTGIIMAEKYMYLGSFAISLLVAFLINKLIIKENQWLKISGVILTLILAIFYGSVTYARNFDWHDNLTLWQATLKVRPDYGRVYSNLGFSYYQQKEYQQALEFFLKAKELEPELPPIYHNLGNVYDELGEYNQAIKNYQKALALKEKAGNFNYAETYNNLGTVYQKIGKLDEALAQYQKAITLNPTYFRAYSNSGVIYLIKEDYQTAKDYFQKTLAISFNFAAAHQGLAIALVNLAEVDEAIIHYQQSINFDPTLTESYNHLASIYNQQKNPEKAIEILKEGVKANSNDAELLTNLAIVLGNDGQLSTAVEYLQEALKIDPNYQPALKALNQINNLETK